MVTSSENRVIILSAVHMDLVLGILKRLNGPTLLELYKTNRWMSEAIEGYLEKMDPRHFNLGKALALHLATYAITVENALNYNYGRSSKTLPVYTLNSNIWKFMTFEEIHMKDNETAHIYLDHIKHEKPGVRVLQTANCDVALILRALELLQPRHLIIESFTGDHSQILPSLPVKKWIASTGGSVTFPPGHVPSGDLFLGVCKIAVYAPMTTEVEKHYSLRYPDGKTFLLSMLPSSISITKAEVIGDE